MKNISRKYYLTIILLFFSAHSAQAAEYSKSLKSHIIHRSEVIVPDSALCRNMLLSTKVGNYVEGVCNYIQETPQTAVDYCGPFELNGGILEDLVGQGYTCAATHVYTINYDQNGYDEFKLISNKEGHYVQSYSEIHLNFSKK